MSIPEHAGSTSTTPSTPAAAPTTDSGASPTAEAQRGGCHRKGAGGRCGGRGRFVGVLLAVLFAALLGSFIGRSFGDGGPGWFGGYHGLASTDPAVLDQRVERSVRRLADKVDATPAQQEKLAGIAKAAVRDIGPVRAQLQTARGEVIALLKADNVDEAAIERLRSAQLKLADSASQRLTRAMADAVEVLTPQQRQKIAGRLEQWQKRMGNDAPVTPPAGKAA